MDNFTCPRTCAFMELCRFQPILSAVGSAGVYSHTVKVKVDMTDTETLRRAVEGMGGRWIGQGTHAMFAGQSATGLGFTLPNWRYPLTVDSAGELHYDDYHGSWGNVADLATLRAEYAFSRAETAAVEQGWQTERTADGLRVYHPSGGILDLSKTMLCETTGFIGSGCHDARLQLGLPAAEAPVNKTEHDQAQAQCQMPT